MTRFKYSVIFNRITVLHHVNDYKVFKRFAFLKMDIITVSLPGVL